MTLLATMTLRVPFTRMGGIPGDILQRLAHWPGLDQDVMAKWLGERPEVQTATIASIEYQDDTEAVVVQMQLLQGRLLTLLVTHERQPGSLFLLTGNEIHAAALLHDAVGIYEWVHEDGRISSPPAAGQLFTPVTSEQMVSAWCWS